MKRRPVFMVGRTPEQLAEHLEAKRLIGDLILVAKATSFSCRVRQWVARPIEREQPYPHSVALVDRVTCGLGAAGRVRTSGRDR